MWHSGNWEVTLRRTKSFRSDWKLLSPRNVCASSSTCAKWLLHMYFGSLNASAFKLCAMAKCMIFLGEVIFLYRTSISAQRVSKFEKTQRGKKKLQTQKFRQQEELNCRRTKLNGFTVAFECCLLANELHSSRPEVPVKFAGSRETGNHYLLHFWRLRRWQHSAFQVPCMTIGLNGIYLAARGFLFFATTSCALILSG